MEGGFKVVLFMTVLIVAAMPHGSWAQTTHVVGDSLGWLVPPGGGEAYRTWAASRTFSVGDVLEFNFGTGTHDVAEVSTAAYESCNSTSPISISTNGPTRINLTSAREYNFICTFTRHCDLGQRLAINVSSTAPAPQPAATAPSPTLMVPATQPPAAATPEMAPPVSIPAPAPAPSPSRLARTYTVGDSLGWAVPPGGQVAYETWARTTRFMVGDILLFNFSSGAHDVIEVTRAEFDSCNISSTTTTPITTGPARIPLTTAGEHHYICTFGQHCSLGQKLAVTVISGGSTVTPPSSSTPSTPSPATAPPPPSSSATSFVVTVFPYTFLTLALAFLYN